MAELTYSWLRPFFRVGTGAGIVVGERDLTIHLARVRPGGARLLATMTVENFRERPAAEWGSEYGRMLAAHQARHVTALVVLPRHETIVRLLPLPGVADQDAAQAIRFQLETLHPYGEDEVAYDFHRLGRSGTFVVAIAERRVIDTYTALFAEAGIALAGITFSGAAIHRGLRLFGEPPESGVLAVPALQAGAAETCEVYGESPASRLFSAEFDMPVERAVALAAAEMRLEPGTPAADLMELLPRWRSAPEQMDFSEGAVSRAALPWAAALASACPRLAPAVNLLPMESRKLSSRAAYVPSIALAVVLVVLGAALALRSAWMDARYNERLQAEIGRLEPVAKRVENLDRRIAEASERMQLVDAYRKKTIANLDIVLEMTQTLPPPAWLTGLQIDANEVVVSGESEQADGLLKKLDASPRLTGSEFTMPLARNGNSEIFRIKAQRRGVQR